MPTIYMLKGLPASGKTTLARQMVRDGGVKRISKDDLRAMLDNSRYSPADEQFVIGVRDFIVESAIRAGLDAVIDDTNLNPIHEEALRNLAAIVGAGFEVIALDTPPEECVLRDAGRERPVGAEVIWKMYNQYMARRVGSRLHQSRR